MNDEAETPIGQKLFSRHLITPRLNIDHLTTLNFKSAPCRVKKNKVAVRDFDWNWRTKLLQTSGPSEELLHVVSRTGVNPSCYGKLLSIVAKKRRLVRLIAEDHDIAFGTIDLLKKFSGGAGSLVVVPAMRIRR